MMMAITGIPEFESLHQAAEMTAASLVQVTAHQAFWLYQDKEFRRLANFEVLSQVEQDRIFNELVVSYTVLIHWCPTVKKGYAKVK